MESKQSFGAYILQRRKELGLTQKEFAQRLFVTDSAVSKWERGLAYPDITLLQSICQILEISEKELLSASEDVEGRRSEQLARKYIRMTRRYRLVQYILYGLLVLTCFIVNLAVQHTLSWFWIALGGAAMGASLTLLPALVPEGKKALSALGGFTGSLLLLLLACCLYTGGRWFFVAAAGVLFGMGLVFLPWVLRQLTLPEPLAGQTAALYIGLETLLLLFLLGMGCLYTGGRWFFVAAAAALFGVGLVLGPVVLWRLPVAGRRRLIYVTAETVLLVLLLGAACIYTGGDWFLSAAVWSVFGISVALLPAVIGQIPLPEPLGRHKAALYLAVESVFLLGALAMEGWGSWFPMPSLWIALLCLCLPWCLLGIIRYLPIGGWFRASLSFFATGLWIYLVPWALDRVLMEGGWYGDQPYSLRLHVDFSRWDIYSSENVLALILLALALLGVLCAVAGVLWKRRRKK